MSQQGLRQASIRSVTGTALSYEGDWHALFTAAGIALGDFNGRLLKWLNLKLSAAYTSLPDAMAAFALVNGATNFSAVGQFVASLAPDTTAPVITSSAAVSINENVILEYTLTANEIVTWTIRTAAQSAASLDYAQFEIAGATLRWVGNGTRDYENPRDSGANNRYDVVVRATDYSGNASEMKITVTVLNVSDGTGDIPSPSWSLFGDSGLLDPSVSFSRASPATMVDETGKITWAPHNLTTYSKFETAGWGPSGCTLTPNAALAPDGTMTATRVTALASSDFQFQNVSPVGRVGGIFSWYEKSESFRGGHGLSDPGVGTWCYVDHATGTPVGANYSTVVTRIDVGNGWYRFFVSAPNLAYFIFSNFTVVAGDSYLIWGAQYEQATYKTEPSLPVFHTKAAIAYGPRVEPNGLLIEGARTNIALSSEDFTTAAWAAFPGGIVATGPNAILAPDGRMTADLCTIDHIDSGGAVIYQTAGTGLTGIYTQSVFIKRGTANFAFLRPQVGVSMLYAWFDLVAKKVGVVQAGLTAAIEEFADGWLRISATRDVTPGGANPDYLVIGLCDADNTANGTVGKTAYLWGAQYEAGKYVSSYIPTAAAAVARAADFAQVASLDFTDWYNTVEGTFVADAETSYDYRVTYQTGIAPDFQYTTSVGVYAGSVPERTTVSGEAYNLAGDGTFWNAPFVVGKGPHRSALAYSLNDMGFTVDGAVVVEKDELPLTPPTATNALAIGWGANTYHLDGHIKSLEYFGTRLSNANLQTLTLPPVVVPVADWSAFNKAGTALDPSVTLVRSTPATFVNSVGVVTTAPVNSPRFEYDPITLALKGLLVEEARSNFLKASADFADAAWNKGNCSVTANAALAPDGTMTADYVGTWAATDAWMNQSAGAYSGPMTLSVFVKPDTVGATPTWYWLKMTNLGAADAEAWFDIINKKVGTTNGTTGARIEEFPGGWLRISISFNANGTPHAWLWPVVGDQQGTSNGSNFYVWGAQAENGWRPSSYIPTTTTPVARTADITTVTGANFSSWFNQAEGTFVCEAELAEYYRFWFSAGTAASDFANAIDMYNNNPPGSLNADVYNNALEFRAIWSGLSLTGLHKAAIAYKQGDYGASADGGAAITSIGIGVTLPSPDGLSIGCGQGQGQLLGHIRSLEYYRTRKSNLELQELTAPAVKPPKWSAFNAAGTALDPSVTFSRASGATYVSAATGLIVSAAADIPRFEAKGLLIEEYRANQLSMSNTFTSWSGIDILGTAAAAISPDGTMNATKLTPASLAYNEKVVYLVPGVDAVANSATFYAKPAGLNYVGFKGCDTVAPGGWFIVVFNIATGVVAFNLSGLSAKIEPAGNGWYRCIVKYTPATPNNHFIIGPHDGSTGDTHWVPVNTTDGVYVFGAQLETGAFPTSYIPTVGTPVARSPDYAVVTGAAFSSWYKPTEGTFVAEYAFHTGYFPFVWSVGPSDQNSANSMQLHLNQFATGIVTLSVAEGGTRHVETNRDLGVASGVVKTAAAYKVNDCAESTNGGAPIVDVTAPALSPGTNLAIGWGSTGAIQWLNGHIKSLTYYDTRLPNSELPGLST